MRIAFVCIDSTGHVNAMTALARALKARGHDVVCVSLPEAEAAAAAAQLPFAAYGKGEYSTAARRAALLQYSSLHGGEAAAYAMELKKAALSAAFKHLPRTLREIRAGAVVLDQLYFGLGLVPTHLGIPYAHASCAVHIDFTGATPLPIFDWPPATTDEEFQRNRQAAAQFLRGLQPLRSLADAYAASAGIHVDWTDPWATQSRLAWLSQMPREFDFPASHWPSCFHHTGPWHDANGRAPVVFPWQQLTGRPLIYASMGTLLNGMARPFRAILEAARANPGLQMVLSIGANLDPKELPPLPENVVAVRHAPQFELLKRAAVCITHAGLNTTLEALTQGVPLLAIPVGTDHPGVAARIRHTRTGIPVPFESATPARITAALQEILEDTAYRESAVAMQAAIRRADGLQHAAGLLEQAFGLDPEPPRRQPSRFAWLRPFAHR
jgi:MGT family glycosyltransferase